MKALSAFLFASLVVQVCSAKELSRNLARHSINTKEQSEIGGKIVGGTDVTDDKKYPFFVRIVAANLEFWGGNLIADNVILTSAVAGNYRFLSVHAGDPDLDFISGHEQIRNATLDNVIVHPNFVLYLNDIALIILDEPFILNEYVNVIPLEQENLSPNLHAGEKGTSIGQGQNSDVSFPSTLVEADLDIITNESCGYNHPGIMCADTTNGKSTCDSDLGGPFFQVQNNQKILIGTNSFTHVSSCEEGKPVGFSRIAYYIGWIESELQKLGKTF